VFAGEDAAIFFEQVARVGHDFGELSHVCGKFGVEQVVDMQTARAGVGEVGNLVIEVLLAKSFELGDVIGEVSGRHGGVIHNCQRFDIAAHAHQNSEARRAHLPNGFDGGGVGQVKNG
jgi:hypothetical protein